MEYPITASRIQTGDTRGKSLTSDYVPLYHSGRLTDIEAKSIEQDFGELFDGEAVGAGSPGVHPEKS